MQTIIIASRPKELEWGIGTNIVSSDEHRPNSYP